MSKAKKITEYKEFIAYYGKQAAYWEQRLKELDMADTTPQPATPEPVLFIHPDTFAMNNAHVGAWKPGHELTGYIPLYTHPAPSVPATSVPVAWNSIQIASWIGSQLMHEPSMFERATVCKFVRSLGRHPTLLKHSPKLHPAPSVPDDVARDAERYRWLRKTRFIWGDFSYISGVHPTVVGLEFGWFPTQAQKPAREDLDAAIDAAILADKVGGKQ